MFRYRSSKNDKYSDLVYLLKIAFPALAIIILVYVFFAIKGLDRSAIATNLVEVIANRYNEPSVSELKFSGVLDGGSVMSLRAASGQIDYEGRTKLLEVNVVIVSPQDEVTTISSNVGFFSQDGDLVELKGQVRAVELSGYVLSTERLMLSLRSGKISSVERTTLTSRLGRITGMEFEYHSARADAGSTMNFSNGVRFIFDQGEK